MPLNKLPKPNISATKFFTRTWKQIYMRSVGKMLIGGPSFQSDLALCLL